MVSCIPPWLVRLGRVFARRISVVLQAVNNYSTPHPNPMPHKTAILALIIATLAPAAAAQARGPSDDNRHSSGRDDITFARLSHPDGTNSPRPGGLSRLAWELRRRTSVAVSLDVAEVGLGDSEIFDHPLLFWQGQQSFEPLGEDAISALRRHIEAGGTLFIDLSDGSVGGGFDRSTRRALARVFPRQRLQRVPLEHVFYKSFYLLDRHGGRIPSRAHIQGIYVGDRLAVIHYANDLAGAMARDSFGEWLYDVGPGGNATRETTFRLGINLAMYALCLDYKADQVHIPFILKRRR